MSGRPASHLGGDAGAGVAAVLWQGWQQCDPEDWASPYQEERAWPEPQQSTRFVQCGADDARWAKMAILPPSPALQQGQEPALGAALEDGSFLLYFLLCF